MIVPGSPIPASTPITYDRTYINRTRSGHYRIFLKLANVSVATSASAFSTQEWASQAALRLDVAREQVNPADGTISFDPSQRTLIADGTTWNYPIDNRPAPTLPPALPAGLTQPVT